LVSFIAFGVCGIVAMIVEERLGAPGQAPLPERGAQRLFRFHAIWAPILYVPLLFGSTTMIAGGGAVLLDQTLGEDPRPVVLLNAPSHLPAHFFATRRQWAGAAHAPIDVLYAGLKEIELTRSAPQRLELAAPSGYFASRVERVERDPRRKPMQVGDIVETQRMRVEVLEAKDGAPTRVRFDFAQPLSDARVYAWQGRKLELLALPQLGEHVRIRAASAL
jgi:hypothetical protein